jgi:hypothetical protein
VLLDRCGQTRSPHREPEPAGLVLIVPRLHLHRALDVPQQHLLHLGGERLVEDHRGDLEVEAEGPVVEGGGADGRDVVVEKDHLLVQEAVGVAEEADAGAGGLL